MTFQKFLTVGEKSLSLEEALYYLRASGEMQRVVQKIVYQYFIEEQLKVRQDIDCSDFEIDRAIMEFRLQNKLLDLPNFNQWLKTNHLNYQDFRNKVSAKIRTEKLKLDITKSQIEEFLDADRKYLDRVKLSRFFIEKKEIADNLKQRIKEGMKFDDLLEYHSSMKGAVVNETLDIVSLLKLEPALRAALKNSCEGDTIEPIKLEKGYIMFEVKERVTKKMEEKIDLKLTEKIFENWMHEQMKEIEIKLEVK